MLVIENLILKKKSGYYQTSACFRIGKTVYDLWYRTKRINYLDCSPFLIACLIPAMILEQDLEVRGMVSLKLLKSLDEIMRKYNAIYPELKPINITASIPQYIYKGEKNTASFFTCGVDSFYTLLKHRDEIKKIVYVHGFDVWMHEKEYLSMMSSHVNAVANEMGKELIEVETNLHEFSENFVDWNIYHTSALASVGVLLQNNIDKIYLASSFPDPELRAMGGPSETDKLWSTEQLEIVPDGFEANRVEKTLEICKNDTALNHLRVCLGDRSTLQYNCCQCEKCVRTIIPLYITGVLDKCKTLQLKDSLPDLISSNDFSNFKDTIPLTSKSCSKIIAGIRQAIKKGLQSR